MLLTPLQSIPAAVFEVTVLPVIWLAVVSALPRLIPELQFVAVLPVMILLLAEEESCIPVPNLFKTQFCTVVLAVPGRLIPKPRELLGPVMVLPPQLSVEPLAAGSMVMQPPVVVRELLRE